MNRIRPALPCACWTSELNCSYEVLAASLPNNASMSGWLIPPKMASRTSRYTSVWGCRSRSSACERYTGFDLSVCNALGIAAKGDQSESMVV